MTHLYWYQLLQNIWCRFQYSFLSGSLFPIFHLENDHKMLRLSCWTYHLQIHSFSQNLCYLQSYLYLWMNFVSFQICCFQILLNHKNLNLWKSEFYFLVLYCYLILDLVLECQLNRLIKLLLTYLGAADWLCVEVKYFKELIIQLEFCLSDCKAYIF